MADYLMERFNSHVQEEKEVGTTDFKGCLESAKITAIDTLKKLCLDDRQTTHDRITCAVLLLKEKNERIPLENTANS